MLALLAAAAFTCGAATRPGLAQLGEDGVWRGRLVDLCRARAAAAGLPMAFHSYDGPAMLRAAASDRLAFLSPDEAAVVRARGPLVATEEQVLVTRADSPATAPGALGGRLVCFIIGTRAEDALDAWTRASGVAIERLPFQEPDEMADAFAVGKCAAAAVDRAELPAGARVLAPALERVPIVEVERQGQTAVKARKL